MFNASMWKADRFSDCRYNFDGRSHMLEPLRWIANYWPFNATLVNAHYRPFSDIRGACVP
jgi:hypothetical protein